MANAELTRFAAWTEDTLVLPSGRPMPVERFQRTMLRDYFDGITELVIIIPKKNGKTTLLAALMLYHLIHTDDPDCVVVANSRDQAMKLFEEARGFVQRSPELSRQLRVLRGYREIRVRDPEQPDSPKLFAGIARVLAADADTADGWGGTLALIDELHRAKDGELYGVLYDGLGPRDGRIITISTAGESEQTPLGEMRSKAYRMPGVKRKGAHRYVTDGEAFSLHEWALEPTESRGDLRVVKRANPASWQTLGLLRRRRESPSMTPNRWARFACGIWGVAGEPAFDMDRWDPLMVEGGHIAEGRRITLGFDGSRRLDTTGLVACDIETGLLETFGFWHRPPDADDDWEVPETEVDQTLEWVFDNYDVWRLYGDPPYWETALDRWAGHYGSERVVRWWTNRLKQTALALRAFVTDMVPGTMSHTGDELLRAHLANAIRHDTKMRMEVQAGEAVEDDILWVIRKESRASPNKIDLAMAALLAWTARRDAIRGGLLETPTYRRATFA